MPALGQTSFRGRSGKKYRFKVYPLCTRIRKIPGLYVIASRSHDALTGHKHEVLYVGQTEDLSQPFDKHHKAVEFERYGANCICLHADESENSRVVKEQDLVTAMHPVCNE